MASFFKSLIRFIIGLLMPIILIAIGGAIAGMGITREYDIVAWIGLGFIGAGILWGLAIFFWADSGFL